MTLQIRPTDQYLILAIFLSYLSDCICHVSSRMCVLLTTVGLLSLHIWPHYSTETALLHTMDSVFRSSDQGQPSLLVSFDVNAAVVTINHSTLSNRFLVGFSVSGTALTWLQSYLTDRYQCVRVGQTSSSPTLCIPVSHMAQFWVQSSSRAIYSQLVSLQKHLASAYNSMLTIHNDTYRSLRQICTHDSRYSPTACLLCTVGFVTMAWH